MYQEIYIRNRTDRTEERIEERTEEIRRVIDKSPMTLYSFRVYYSVVKLSKWCHVKFNEIIVVILIIILAIMSLCKFVNTPAYC